MPWRAAEDPGGLDGIDLYDRRPGFGVSGIGHAAGLPQLADVLDHAGRDGAAAHRGVAGGRDQPVD